VKGKLSFGIDEEEAEDPSSPAITSRSTTATPRSNTPLDSADGAVASRLGPNTSIAFAPQILTKAAIAKEAETRERLKKEFLSMQVLVKATDFILPFVFYDGTNVPGGVCRMKKGDPVWLFLDKSRKVGAELGSGTDKSRREWARVGIDDLMLVRNEIIIPHVSMIGSQKVCTS
jgi:protein FAM50